MTTHQSPRSPCVSGPAEMQARLDGFAMTLEMVEGGITDRLNALAESTEKTAGALSALTARGAANSDASAGVQDSIATAILDLRSRVQLCELLMLMQLLPTNQYLQPSTWLRGVDHWSFPLADAVQVAKLEQAVKAASHSSHAVAEAQPPHPPDAGQGPNVSDSVAVLQIKVGAAACMQVLFILYVVMCCFTFQDSRQHSDELAAAMAELNSRLLALAEDLSGLQGQQRVAAQRLKELAAASGSHLTKDDLEDRLQQFRLASHPAAFHTVCLALVAVCRGQL
ncbi:hypothetical protein V8C86DRAFT_778932 [Haematococcus lacustris]